MLEHVHGLLELEPELGLVLGLVLGLERVDGVVVIVVADSDDDVAGVDDARSADEDVVDGQEVDEVVERSEGVEVERREDRLDEGLGRLDGGRVRVGRLGPSMGYGVWIVYLYGYFYRGYGDGYECEERVDGLPH